MAENMWKRGPCLAVITGASRGIGRAITVELAKSVAPGSLLLIIARNIQGLQETQAEVASLGVQVEVQVKQLDLSSATPAQMKEALSGIRVSVSRYEVNLIVHNAGSVGRVDKSIDQLDEELEWRSYYDLNLFRVTFLNNAFLNIVDAKNTVVVNVTSLCAVKPFPGMAQYCSGKAAREMYFRVLAEERPDLRILNYAPGPVRTDMVLDDILGRAVNPDLKNTFTSLRGEGKLLEPEQTARMCIRVLTEGKYKSGDHVDYFDNV